MTLAEAWVDRIGLARRPAAQFPLPSCPGGPAAEFIFAPTPDVARLAVELSHEGPPALAELATIVRDDHEQLKHGFVIYDALHSWCQSVRNETHSWNPQRGPTLAMV